MAALGRGVRATGGSAAGHGRTLEALARFHQLAKEMKLKRLRTVATAAVRDATNGRAFLKRVAELGLKARVISGDEAELAGLGVVSAIPDANGIVADLGGGSQAVRRSAGRLARASPCRWAFSARLGAKQQHHRQDHPQRLKNSRLKDAARGPPPLPGGGSFRALALLDMKARIPRCRLSTIIRSCRSDCPNCGPRLGKWMSMSSNAHADFKRAHSDLARGGYAA